MLLWCQPEARWHTTLTRIPIIELELELDLELELELELVLWLLAAAVHGKEHVHLDQDLQHNKYRIDAEEGYAHALG